MVVKGPAVIASHASSHASSSASLATLVEEESGATSSVCTSAVSGGATSSVGIEREPTPPPQSQAPAKGGGSGGGRGGRLQRRPLLLQEIAGRSQSGDFTAMIGPSGGWIDGWRDGWWFWGVCARPLVRLSFVSLLSPTPTHHHLTQHTHTHIYIIGAGKTTLLHCLSLRVRKFRGALRLNGASPGPSYTATAALVHQHEVLFGYMTVRCVDRLKNG